VETNRYYQQFLDSSDEGPPPQHEVTEAEMFAFLAMTLQMGHTFQHRLDDYFPTKCFLLLKFLPLGSRNIQVFRKACEKFKYPAKQFGKLGLTLGI
jgi:hypothetical protein